LQDPNYEPLPRYWVDESLVSKATKTKTKYWFGFRDITNITNERTVLSTVVPYSAVGNNLPLWFTNKSVLDNCFLLACLASFSCDLVRDLNSVGQLKFFSCKTTAVLPPSFIAHPACLLLGKYLTASVLELSYTAYDLQPFAEDCGYDGPPFIWDEERRFNIRCELDALYFHLYLGTQTDWQTRGSKELLSYFPSPRYAVEYIMDTFPIVKRKDEKEYGEYRTKLRILEIYDQIPIAYPPNRVRSTLIPSRPPAIKWKLHPSGEVGSPITAKA
jgi:hypothetical protein